jgi:hypothetical protein
MEIIDFEGIKSAIQILQMNQSVKKVDGPNWSVYWVGSIMRVDIKKDSK